MALGSGEVECKNPITGIAARCARRKRPRRRAAEPCNERAPSHASLPTERVGWRPSTCGKSRIANSSAVGISSGPPSPPYRPTRRACSALLPAVPLAHPHPARNTNPATCGGRHMHLTDYWLIRSGGWFGAVIIQWNLRIGLD